MRKQKLFLIPGWAVNSNVWYTVAELLNPRFELHFHDFPGYGKRQHENGNLTLPQLADDAISRSPEDAIWLGWSLGSMVALEAAKQSPAKISALSLVCPTPKFITGDDWTCGQSPSAIDNLAQRFHGDYPTALKRFLLLQAGTNSDARSNAKSTMEDILQFPPPTWQTLQSGLAILRSADLRTAAGSITTPTDIIVGQSDRVIPAAAGIALHQSIAGSKLQTLPTGHAPFIEQPDAFTDAAGSFSPH